MTTSALTITAIDTTLTDERDRDDIAEDVAEAINDNCNGGAAAKVWTGGDVVRVYINGGSTKGYGTVHVREDGSISAVTHRTAGTNINDVLEALGAGRF